ncbi:MAG: hypothetical protein QF535_09195 [Anaerolineales bacterium]|nr:hypothetical protein [Anaerolineales bacterium]
MAITKEAIIEKVEVVGEYKAIQVRTDTVIKEDGVELSRSYHRHVIHPDISAEKLANEHAEVQAIANSGIWTQAVKDAWASKLAEQQE